MKAGLFLMPSHPPERDTFEALQWDLDTIEYADKLGYCEAWIGEHFTAPWEPCPAPDLLIAQALTRTERIKLCPGAHLLPYHNPVELAHRLQRQRAGAGPHRRSLRPTLRPLRLSPGGHDGRLGIGGDSDGV